MTTTHIGKYEVVRRLGGGGMAEVFLAKALGAEGFARPVAIKRVLPSYSADPKFAQMFINEARLTAGLRHARSVSTLDFDRNAEGGLLLDKKPDPGGGMAEMCLTKALGVDAVAAPPGAPDRGTMRPASSQLLGRAAS